MKRIFYVVLLLSVCCMMMAQTNTYNFLVFTNTNATTTTFSVTNLTLAVNGNELQVSNDNGTVNLVLTDLASMHFSNDNSATALENVLNADASVEVFAVTGASLGTYGSLLEAAQHLNAGVYVISNGSVKQTVVIKN